jgi:hypothetical protein
LTGFTTKNTDSTYSGVQKENDGDLHYSCELALTIGVADFSAPFELGLSIEFDFSIGFGLSSDLSGTGLPLVKMVLPNSKLPGLDLSLLKLKFTDV